MRVTALVANRADADVAPEAETNARVCRLIAIRSSELTGDGVNTGAGGPVSTSGVGDHSAAPVAGQAQPGATQ